MLKAEDVAESRHGHLVAVEYVRTDPVKGQVWRMRCDCGIIVERDIGQIRYQAKQGKTPACAGCANKRRGANCNAADLRRGKERAKRNRDFFA